MKNKNLFFFNKKQKKSKHYFNLKPKDKITEIELYTRKNKALNFLFNNLTVSFKKNFKKEFIIIDKSLLNINYINNNKIDKFKLLESSENNLLNLKKEFLKINKNNEYSFFTENKLSKDIIKEEKDMLFKKQLLAKKDEFLINSKKCFNDLKLFFYIFEKNKLIVKEENIYNLNYFIKKSSNFYLENIKKISKLDEKNKDRKLIKKFFVLIFIIFFIFVIIIILYVLKII